MSFCSELGLPSTRFLGSKARLLKWINSNTKDLEFNSVLDAFGGTGSFSYLMKTLNKKVYYNDLLKFNQNIATAIIENRNTIITDEEIADVLQIKDREYQKIIASNFKGIYFKDGENRWLDIVTQNILSKRNKYKKAILFSALYQACLIKRPFNLFHRSNLNLRTADVERSFGNKTTWEKSFKKHFIKFVVEYNSAVFDNGQKNKVLGGYDVLKIPKRKYDLVYLDPPYISQKSKLNYLDCYHFLEGISDYKDWESRIDFDTKNKRLKPIESVNNWINEDNISSLFEKMITRYKDSIILLSYRNDGIPSIKEIDKIFKKVTGRQPIKKSIPYKYALSNGSTREVLFRVS